MLRRVIGGWSRILVVMICVHVYHSLCTCSNDVDHTCLVQMYIVDELLSPLVTPFILYFSLRDRAPQIVDFLRNFTIDVSGVGDVCSFAEMNVKKHGNSEVREGREGRREGGKGIEWGPSTCTPLQRWIESYM